MASEATIIGYLRVDLNDTATSNLIRRENLFDQIASGNLTFEVSNFPLVSGSLVVKSNGTTRTPASINLATGTFVLETAHEPTTACIATYYWQFYADSDYQAFLAFALNEVGYTAVSSVPDGLLAALRLFALSRAWSGLYAKHMLFFDTQAAGKGVSKNEIPNRFIKNAELADKLARQSRDDYYTKQGKNLTPAYGQVQTTQNPFTPPR